MALKRIAIPSPFYSSRGGWAVTTIVIHSSEGAQSYQSLGSWFQNPTANVSSHVGIDDVAANTVGEYVRRDYKSWTQANANPYCVSAELCTPSGASGSWSTADWTSRSTMLTTCAAWIAEEAAHFGIPIKRLSPAEAQNPAVKGVCQHVDLGGMGGGHVDCGNGFPFDEVLAMAGGTPPGTTPAPTPPPATTAGPPWPGVYLRDYTEHPSARTWQAQMASRGWTIAVDGMYGPASANVCRQFQVEKGLDNDGIVGPQTWAAAWSAPIT